MHRLACQGGLPLDRKDGIYILFLHDSKPTQLYFTFIEAVKFLWQLDVQGLEIVHKERTPADMERFGACLRPRRPAKANSTKC